MKGAKKATTKEKQERANTEPYQPSIGRPMPFSNDAEKGILSCFFWNPSELLPDARHTIPEAAFYHPANRLMYETCLLFYRWSKPLDYITVSEHLTSKGLMEKVGGQGVVAELLDFVPTPTHYGYYKGILLDAYLLRLGIGIATQHILSAYEHKCGVESANERSGLDEWTRKYAADALELRQQFVQGPSGQDGCDLDAAHDDMVEHMYTKGPSTGYPWMDKVFGGFLDGALMLIAGRRGIGKSSLARQMAWHAAKNLKIPTEIITVEMTKTQYYEGLCCLEGVDSNSFLQRTFFKEELAIMEKLRASSKSVPLKLHDDCRSLDEVISRMETASLKRGARVFLIDMPQRLTGDKSEGRERELSGIFWAIKDAAKRLHATAITPLHLNSALIARGSEDIENHADQMLTMAANKDKPGLLDKWSKKILIKAMKNRYGPEGGRCLFHFTGKHFKFEEAEETEELDIEPAEESKPQRRK